MDDRILYLTRQDVATVAPTMLETIEILRRVFREKAAGRVEMPTKVGIHTTSDGLLHAMPAHLPGLRSAGVKWVGAYPANARRGVPQVTGLIVTNDLDTGLPCSILDCTWITAMRTAAASALAAEYLARKESRTLGILGCGVQGRSHLEAFARTFPLEKVVAYDPRPEAVASLSDAAKELDLPVTQADAPRAAVVECDLIVTAGPIARPPRGTIPKGWLEKGAFASSVDFASSWSVDALRQLDLLVTDDLEQYAYYNARGYLGFHPEGLVDLGALVSGEHPGRRTDAERTMACNLGIAAEDVAVASVVLDRAKEAGIGTWLPR